MTVVVDASVALKWVLHEEDTEDALALWDRWQAASQQVTAPAIFRAEVTNALHQTRRRGLLSSSDAEHALRELIATVAIIDPPDIYDRALALASALQLEATYDALYLALAESQACEMWTADRRLVRSVQLRFPRVHALGGMA